jgi:hypothetical protein
LRFPARFAIDLIRIAAASLRRQDAAGNRPTAALFSVFRRRIMTIEYFH